MPFQNQVMRYQNWGDFRNVRNMYSNVKSRYCNHFVTAAISEPSTAVLELKTAFNESAIL